MSYPAVSTDKSRRIDFHSRCGEPGDVVTFEFNDTEGNPVDVSGENWSLVVKRKPNSPTDLFELTEGDGLTVTGDDDNKLEVSLPEAEADQDPGVFFARLISNTAGKTRFNGHWQFHDGLFDGVPPVTAFTVNWAGTTINVTVEWGGSGGSSALIEFGDHDASGNTFPDGVSYTFYNITVAGTVDGIDLYPGDTLMKRIASPTADWNPLTGWKKF